MALRLLAAALLCAAAWQCAFVAPSASSRAPQVSVKASGVSSRGVAPEDADFMAPVMSLGVGAMVGLLVAVSGAAPAFADEAQDGSRYGKPEGTDNLLKELSVDKKKFYEGRTDLYSRMKSEAYKDQIAAEKAAAKAKK